jgi:hypothetical protein
MGNYIPIVNLTRAFSLPGANAGSDHGMVVDRRSERERSHAPITSISKLQMSQFELDYSRIRGLPQIHRGVSNTSPDALDDLRDTEIVNIICCDQLKSDGFVVLYVYHSLPDVNSLTE